MNVFKCRKRGSKRCAVYSGAREGRTGAALESRLQEKPLFRFSILCISLSPTPSSFLSTFDFSFVQHQL